jgi:hypothetical protein
MEGRRGGAAKTLAMPGLGQRPRIEGRAESAKRRLPSYRRFQSGARAKVRGTLRRDPTPRLAKLLAVLVMVAALWGILAVPRLSWLVLGVLVVVAPLLGRAQ